MAEVKVEPKKDTARQIAVVFGILSIVLALLVILMAVNVIPTVNSNRAAKLINVGMGGQDYGSEHRLHISGYVCNVGLETAYKTQLHVTGVYTTGGAAIDTYVDINPSIIYSQKSAYVEADVPYSADGLGSWYITPVWTYSP